MNEVNKISNIWIKNRELSKNSFRLYQLELERFSAWMDFRNLILCDLTPILMSEYLECLKFDPKDNRSQFHIRRKKALSESSIEQSRRILNAFFEWALKNSYISRSPFWTFLENDELFKSVTKSAKFQPNLSIKIKKVLYTKTNYEDEVNLRAATIANLAFWVGASREEIARLTVGNFIVKHNCNYIALPYNKGKAIAKILLPKQAGLVIQQYLKCRKKQNSLLSSNAALVASIKTGEFMTGWSIRHTLRNWQKDEFVDQRVSIVGPRQLRQAFQGFAVRKEIPERIISEHFRVRNLTLPDAKLYKGYPIRLYKAVSAALVIKH